MQTALQYTETKESPRAIHLMVKMKRRTTTLLEFFNKKRASTENNEASVCDESPPSSKQISDSPEKSI